MSEYSFTVRPLSVEDDGGYLIEFPDLPGCMSDGETVEDAIRNGEDAKRDWIAAMKEAGRPIPLPLAEPADSYSGKWQLRTPKSLHRRLAERAKQEGVSLNTLAVTLLAEGLGQRTGGAIGTNLDVQQMVEQMLENASQRAQKSRRYRARSDASAE
jgi:antitoxin HicB